jgi:2-aminoethylphosphonate-pyruvate transaminase
MPERPETAVILAAGRGTRLADVTAGRPKGLIAVGDRSIILESIEKLRRHGFARIVLVTGHGAAQIEQASQSAGDGVEVVFNDRFAETGSMWSFCCAMERCDGPLLLLESDLIYENRALAAVLDGVEADVVLASGPTAAGDEVWIEADERADLVAMSKDRGRLGADPFGELVGITRISRRLRDAMLAAAQRRGAGTSVVDYEDCLTDAAAGHPVRCRLVTDLAWTEIDTPDHFARARDVIYPRILERDAEG